MPTRTHTRTCMGLPTKMSPKTWKMVEKWMRYTQIWWFSWNWLYLIQFSTKKHVLGLVLKFTCRKIATHTNSHPWPIWVWKTHAFPYLFWAVQTKESYPSWLAHTWALKSTTVGCQWGTKTIFVKNHINLSEYWQVHCCESFLPMGCDCHGTSFLATQVQPATQRLKI